MNKLCKKPSPIAQGGHATCLSGGTRVTNSCSRPGGHHRAASTYQPRKLVWTPGLPRSARGFSPSAAHLPPGMEFLVIQSSSPEESMGVRERQGQLSSDLRV